MLLIGRSTGFDLFTTGMGPFVGVLQALLPFCQPACLCGFRGADTPFLGLASHFALRLESHGYIKSPALTSGWARGEWWDGEGLFMYWFVFSCVLARFASWAISIGFRLEILTGEVD